MPRTLSAMTPTQRQVFDDLLQIGAERPVCPPDLAERLRAHIAESTSKAAERWTEGRIFLTKSTVSTALRCEGQLVADAVAPRRGSMPTSSAAGILAHRAIQIAATIPSRTVGEYVSSALPGAMAERNFSELWETADLGLQSDILNTAISRVAAFLDSWPALDPAWTPRFEESITGRAGKVTLSARPDLVLGRPRPDFRQSMLLADLKTGQINDQHVDEAQFYALVSTLRHGVAPYRSTVYSLASGEYTDPDVTEASLFAAADRVIAAACSMVEVLTEVREPVLQPGRHCQWCPAALTCGQGLAEITRP